MSASIYVAYQAYARHLKSIKRIIFKQEQQGELVSCYI